MGAGRQYKNVTAYRRAMGFRERPLVDNFLNYY
jgi:hypothetical protein